MFDSYNRDELRRTYADAWARQLAGSPLTPLEALIVDVIALHPEYHGLVGDSVAALEFQARADTANPFLHMGLHLAVREQLAIDRPPGVRELLRRLQSQCGNGHDGEHVLMEALGEILWQAQRTGLPPDEAQYLALARSRLAAGMARKG